MTIFYHDKPDETKKKILYINVHVRNIASATLIFFGSYELMADKKTKKSVGKKSTSTISKTPQKGLAKKAIKDNPASSMGVSLSKIKSKTGKRKANLLKLCTEMNKIAVDAVDKEVIKRFRILIDAAEEDITKSSLHAVMKNWKDVEVTQFHESFHPYIKHYIFMMKRKLSR